MMSIRRVPKFMCVAAPVIESEPVSAAIQIAGYAIVSSVFLMYIILAVSIVIYYRCRDRYHILSLLNISYFSDIRAISMVFTARCYAASAVYALGSKRSAVGIACT